MNEDSSMELYPEDYVNPDGLNFKSYIMAKMRAVAGLDGRCTLTSAELADTLGMSTKVFLEILNGRRSGPDRRDFVIALCAELELDAEETNEALRLFPGTLRQLSEYDERGRMIIHFLDAGFDIKISYAALDALLRKENLPALKIRYRSPVPDDEWRKNTMNKNKINWGLRTEEERQRYNYYTSLGYDDRTATVLSLFTYGKEEIPYFKIREAYEALAAGEPYPAPPEPDDDSIKDPASIEFNRLFGKPHTTQMGLHISPSEKPEVDAELPVGSIGASQAATPALEPVEALYSIAIPMDELLFSETAELNSGRQSPVKRRKPLNLSSPAPSYSIALDTDEYVPFEEKDFRTVMQEFTSTFRMTTNTASAGIVLNQLRNGRRIDKSMVRIEEMLNYFRYKAEKPAARKFGINTELKELENGNKLLYIHVQGKEEVKERQNIVIVLDVSGSMSRNTVQTQAAVATIISRLKPGDSFSLVTYSNKDHVIVDGLPITSREDITRILEKLLGLEITGGTYGSAGIEMAYAVGRRNYKPDGNNQVILITDGDLNFGITSQGGLENLIEEKKKANLFLSVIGTGLYNYKDNKLESLCKHGNGVYRVINNITDVKKSIRDDYYSLVNVIAKDVKAQVEFNPETVRSFRLLGFENRELSHEEFTDDKVISEPFGSGGYGVALYELGMQQSPEPQVQENRYTRVTTTGSQDLCTVKIRYKEPLEEVSHEIEHVVANAGEHYTDNLLLAHAVYIAAEKLRNSEKIEQRDEAIALMELDTLGTELQVMNLDDLPKLRAILTRSKDQLHVGYQAEDDFPF